MKIHCHVCHPRRESGLAVIVVMTILSILLIYIAGNLRMLHHLSRDLKLIEQKQIRRLEATNAPINLSVVTTLPLPSSQAASQTNAPAK